MSYLRFHRIFILPPLALAGIRAARVVRRDPGLGLGAAVLVAAAYVWTTPWDNYLVAKDIWSYGPGRVRGTLGYVPVEEYAFFGLQTLLASAVVIIELDRRGLLDRSRPTQRASARTLRWLAAAWLGSAALTLAEPTRYLGLILAWILPPLAVQWWYGGPWLADRLRQIAPALAVLTLYLWAADGYAIDDGIWSISPRYTTGLKLGPLPIEEALFFLATNLVVGQGLTLFASLKRAARSLAPSKRGARSWNR